MVYAQVGSLNADFLDSLPQNIQEELMLNIEGPQTDETYNLKPNTRIFNLEQGIDKIKTDIKNLESTLMLESKDFDSLKIFGHDFFSSYQTSFAPINEFNFTADYILDVGDKLDLQIFGKSNLSKKVFVLRDGTINIPRVGVLRVAGLEYSDALDQIAEFVRTKNPSVEVSVGLEKSRDIRVLLVGNVKNPGMYTLSGGSTVLSLLHAAGGISSNGSLREIQHKRNNKLIQSTDLYGMLLNGDLSEFNILRSGDVVLVPPAKKLVSITGGVFNPAIYEILEGENIINLYEYAGGLINTKDPSGEIYLRDGSIIPFNDFNESDYSFENGDSIFARLYSPINREVFKVKISGAVESPGTYSFSSGEKLSDIIAKAGGYEKNAYPKGGQLYRKSVAQIEKEIVDRTYRELITYIASTSSSPVGGLGLSATTNLPLILAEIKNIKPKGRLASEFNLNKLKEDPSLDTILSHNDEIVIPYFTSEVFVLGEVQSPGAYRFVAGQAYKGYIDASGGLGQFAYPENTIVISPSGEAYAAKNRLAFLNNQIEIYPGSIIYVPREIGKLEGVSLAATIAPIISSLALSLASLNSID